MATPTQTKNVEIGVQLPYRPGMQANELYTSSLIDTLDGMPFQDYAKWFQGRIKQANDHRRRDTRVIGAGTTVAAANYPFFKVPLNGSETSLDGGTTFNPKPKALTNMIDDNRMEYGSFFIIESVQCFLIATAREFKTITTGQPTDLSPAVAEGTNSASTTVIGLARNCYMTFKVGNDRKADGRIAEFPSDIVFTGAFGGASTTGGVGDEGFVQIGAGKPRMLREIVVLRPGQYFTVELEFARASLVSQNVELEIAFSGVLLESVG